MLSKCRRRRLGWCHERGRLVLDVGRLAPKDGQGAPNLHVAGHHIVICKREELFRLYEIGHVALKVGATAPVTSARSGHPSAGDEGERGWLLRAQHPE